MNFGDRFQYAFKGKTTEEIAKILGLSDQAVRNYINGRIPDKEVIVKIAEATDVSMSWLLIEKGSPNIPSSEEFCVEVPLGLNRLSIINELAERETISVKQKTLELVLASLAACNIDESARRRLLLDLVDISRSKEVKTQKKKRKIS
ncbi:MAG: helix-turn-helix transcriptional regulator [Blastocatellia bacterium]